MSQPLTNRTDDASTEITDDDMILQKMGYEKKLYRGLSAFANFAFGFTEVAVLPSFISLYGGGLTSGGPSIIVWGFLVTYAMTMIVSFSMAEICSAYPSAGSVYHWTAQVVPAHLAPLASYICGWFNFLGNAAGDASFAYAWATTLTAAIQVTHGVAPLVTDDGSSYAYNSTMIASSSSSLSSSSSSSSVVDDDWQPYTSQATVAISIAMIFAWSILSAFRVDQVGWVNNIAAFTQMASIFIICVTVLVKPTQLASNEQVFTTYYNATGFRNKSYVCCLGMLTSLYSFAGYEASAHMAEETNSSRTVAPKGIIYTCFATGIGGVFLLFSLLYATPDIDLVVNGPTSNVAVNVFYYACGAKWAQGLSWLVVINLFFAGVSSVSVTGRIVYALMRDRAFPYAEFLAQVHPTFQSPIYAIVFVGIFDCALQCIPLAGSDGYVAFASIVGLSTIGFQISYAIPVMLKVIYQPKDFPITSMNLGWLSMPMGIASSAWLIGTSCFFFFPTSSPVTKLTMNWVVVVVFGFLFFAALNWLLNSQYHFRGPPRHQEEGEVGSIKPVGMMNTSKGGEPVDSGESGEELPAVYPNAMMVATSHEETMMLGGGAGNSV